MRATSCGNSAFREDGRLMGNPAAVTPTKICERCGKTFSRPSRRNLGHYARQRFCSHQCRGEATRGIGVRGAGFDDRTCRACGRSFRVYAHAIASGKAGAFCSRACANPRRHPDIQVVRREQERRRRARKRATTELLGSHTIKEWEDLKRCAKDRCVKCRRKRKLTRDHIIPLSKGGHDRITNIQPLCGPCNSSKRTRIEVLL